MALILDSQSLVVYHTLSKSPILKLKLKKNLGLMGAVRVVDNCYPIGDVNSLKLPKEVKQTMLGTKMVPAIFLMVGKS